MSLFRRTLVAVTLASSAIASSAAPSLAADTTPPTLSLTSSGVAGLHVIYNQFAWGYGSGRRAGEWSIVGPGLGAKSSEAGNLVFTRRDAFSGRALNVVTVPTAGGSFDGPPSIDSWNPTGPTLFPVTFTALRGDVENAIFGVRHRLATWSVQRFDAQAIDAAGNKSRVRTTYSVVLPDLTLPDINIPIL